MTINFSVWRLAAQILISTLILNIILSYSKPVEAELRVNPQWNITANQTDSHLCDLATDINLQDVVIFTGDVIQTCSVQLTASNGTAVQIRIPEGAFVYVERQGNIPDCQLKYLYITAEEPCIFVFRHLKFRLFLRGDGINGSYINISQMTANTSATLCPDETSSEGLYTSRVSQTNHCQAHEVDDLISCNISR